MSDLKIRYLDNTVNVDSVTQTDYSNWYNGSEIVIAGKLKDNSVNNIIAQVSQCPSDVTTTRWHSHILEHF